MNIGAVQSRLAAGASTWVLRIDELKGQVSELLARDSVMRRDFDEAIAARLDIIPLEIGDVLLLLSQTKILAAGVLSDLKQHLCWAQVPLNLDAAAVFAGESEPTSAPKKLEGTTKQNFLLSARQKQSASALEKWTTPRSTIRDRCGGASSRPRTPPFAL